MDFGRQRGFLLDGEDPPEKVGWRKKSYFLEFMYDDVASVFHSDVKWTSNINNQALPLHLVQYNNVSLVVFNLVVSLYFEVLLQLVNSGFIHWLWLMVVIFFIPVITLST